MTSADVEIDDRALREALKHLLEKIGNLEPAYRDIGEKWLLNTRIRYDQLATGASVDGVQWAELSQVTKDRKTRNKDKILVESGTMRNDRMVSRTEGGSLLLGSSDIRAATHQFGAKMGEFGRYSQIGRVKKYGLGTFQGSAGTKKGFPIPWGDIPARPFVMVSGDDEQDFLDIIADHLKGAFSGG